jgi:hypothetical protein
MWSWAAIRLYVCLATVNPDICTGWKQSGYVKCDDQFDGNVKCDDPFDSQYDMI